MKLEACQREELDRGGVFEMEWKFKSEKLTEKGASILLSLAITFIIAVLVILLSLPMAAQADAHDTNNAVTCLSSSENPIDLQIDAALGSNKPIFLFFYAEWCHFCQQAKAIMDELEQEYAERIAFIRVNSEQNPQAVKEFGVSTFPTMFLIHDKSADGEYVYSKFEGFVDKESLKEGFEKVITNESMSGGFESPPVSGKMTNVSSSYSPDSDDYVIYKGDDFVTTETGADKSVYCVDLTDFAINTVIAHLETSANTERPDDDYINFKGYKSDTLVFDYTTEKTGVADLGVIHDSIYLFPESRVTQIRITLSSPGASPTLNKTNSYIKTSNDTKSYVSYKYNLEGKESTNYGSYLSQLDGCAWAYVEHTDEPILDNTDSGGISALVGRKFTSVRAGQHVHCFSTHRRRYRESPKGYGDGF